MKLSNFWPFKDAPIRFSISLKKEERIYNDLDNNCPEIIGCFGATIMVTRGIEFYNIILEYAPAGALSDMLRRTIVGYVHCDLKPENILAFPLDKNESRYELKLVDFGLAKEPGEHRCVAGDRPWQLGKDYRTSNDLVHVLAFSDRTPQIPHYMVNESKESVSPETLERGGQLKCCCTIHRLVKPTVAELAVSLGFTETLGQEDNTATKDKMNTTAGSFALLGSVVPRDAPVVTKLRKAGAIILGKASLSEWSGFRGNAPPGWSARGGQGR
ncbi:Amidase, partial [Trema orientale]